MHREGFEAYRQVQQDRQRAEVQLNRMDEEVRRVLQQEDTGMWKENH